MMDKFLVGQAVAMPPSLFRRSGQTFIVVRQMPERDGELQYRIKGASDEAERVVKEHELSVLKAETYGGDGDVKAIVGFVVTFILLAVSAPPQ